MNCAIHDVKMVKDSKTGLENCLKCGEIDAIMDDLHDMGEWQYTIKDVESYLRGADKANIGDLFTKKEGLSNE